MKIMKINKLQAFEYHYRRANYGIPLKEEYTQPYKDAANEVNAAYGGLTSAAKVVFNNILAIGRMETTGDDTVCAELISTGLFLKEETSGRTYVYPI